ncbi:uncharacterized protein LOC127115200 [Lathyrus oleraceus]|uniref:uncharacterized protein LOC127115200 n=1 Tax=Pisum sativum TaxID=3888 RepID=UPI0021CFA8A5|nr:uncharacterized protein LOC127115200 [Pisum sativum]
MDNWDTKGTFKGFSRRFLEDLVVEFEKADNWKAFNVVIALPIHGIMIFPNIENFMDQIAMEIFLSGNPIPFLLASIYYSLHDHREEKGGTLLCCAPLLHAWLMTHMKEEVPIFSKELKWSQKLGSITASNIKWYIRDWETEDIITNYGNFPNVPLWGTMGCINYNPVISLRKHNYPVNGTPETRALQPFILHDLEMSNPVMKRVRRAWLIVVREGKELGKRNTLVKEPYTKWVKERAQVIKLPYPFDPSIFPLVPEPEPILPKDVEKLNAIIKELVVENTELMIKLNRVTLENENMKNDRERKDKELEATNKRARESDERREKFGHALKGTKYVLKTKNQELDQAIHKIQELNKTVERTLEMKREARSIYEICTREFENTI